MPWKWVRRKVGYHARKTYGDYRRTGRAVTGFGTWWSNRSRQTLTRPWRAVRRRVSFTAPALGWRNYPRKRTRFEGTPPYKAGRWVGKVWRKTWRAYYASPSPAPYKYRRRRSAAYKTRYPRSKFRMRE